jgi:exodeoxyribonuclease VII large subunit
VLGKLQVLGETTRRLAEAHGLRRAEDVLLARQQRLDDVATRLGRSAPASLQRASDRLGAVELRLRALSPQAILERGYSITRRLPDHEVVRDARRLRRGDAVDILLARGSAVCSVTESRAREE